MSGFLLDTNVISEMTFDAPNPQVIAFLAAQDNLWLSAVVVHELEYGLQLLPPGHRRDRLVAAHSHVIRAYGDRIVPLRRRSRTGRDLLFLLNPSLRHASARVTPSWPITRAIDLLAAHGGDLEVAAGGFDLAFEPGSVRVVSVD